MDKTLNEIDRNIIEKKRQEPPRHYLGMSQIGEECERKLFYGLRKCSEESYNIIGIKAANDGHQQELEMSNNLKELPYIELFDRDPDNPEKQIGYKLLLDHFRGHLDGMINGILEAPTTWHVWEHKCKKQTDFNKLKKIRDEKGEKDALQEWDSTYYSQAQIYMHCSKTTRHYMTITTPGGRDAISIRTEYNAAVAKLIIEKAQRIIFGDTLPAKISESPEFYKCKFCDHHSVCHDKEFPLVNCKTCRYLVPVKDGQHHCHLKKEIIPEEYLNVSCNKHIYNPALIQAKLIEHQKDCCIYQLENTVVFFADCYASGMPELKDKYGDLLIYPSSGLRDKIKYLDNLLDKNTVKIQKEFDGEFDNKKAWDKTSKLDNRLA
jgi:hypothetical protein